MTLALTVSSFGYKFGAMPDADWVVDSRMLRSDDAITPSLARFESHGHRRVLRRRRAQTRQPLETLPTPFGLLAVLPGDVPRDVILLGGDLPLHAACKELRPLSREGRL